MNPRPSSIVLALPIAAAAALALGACGGGGDDSGGGDPAVSLPQFAATPATVGLTPIAASGDRLVYFADEATSGPLPGTDYNGDGDRNDAVPVVLEAPTQAETGLGVAAFQAVWLGEQLYLVVDEAQDGRQWDSTPGDGIVLLHWAPNAAVTFVAALDPRGPVYALAAGSSVFVALAAGPGGAGASTLAALSEAAPTAPRPVATTDAVGELLPTLLAADEDLVFALLDENVHGRDLNGDLDATDVNVVALLDGRGAAAPAGYDQLLRSTGLASPAGAPPVRARRDPGGAATWLVGLLVSEAAQGATNLNTIAHPDLPPSWLPSQCGTLDGDTDDDVLFFLDTATWAADPVANPPVNTGLVGKKRVTIVRDWVGTISQESPADDGFGEPCDLNTDGDRNDDIFRFVRAVTPVLPPGQVAQLFPPEDVPGGAHGVAELGDRWVLAASEAQDGFDYNGDGEMDLAMLGWYDPETSQTWIVDGGDPQNPSYAATTWLGEVPDRSRVGVGFSELGNVVDLNGNGIIGDSVATFCFFDESLGRLVYPGFAVAVQAGNAGIVLQNGHGFYRVSEAAQGSDLNADGDLTDMVLFRSRLSDGITTNMFTLNAVPRGAVAPDELTLRAGAFPCDETMAGDVNQDGRADSFVLVYYPWP